MLSEKQEVHLILIDKFSLIFTAKPHFQWEGNKISQITVDHRKHNGKTDCHDFKSNDIKPSKSNNRNVYDDYYCRNNSSQKSNSPHI